MTTNQDRAAEVLGKWHGGAVWDTGNPNDLAQALADAGLLAPDLTEPSHADEEGTLEWHIPDPNQPYHGIVRLYPNGHIRLVQINAPITSTTTALALSQALAAAAYVQAHQEKK